ncbi:nicotine blue oxidoreductase [Arthrobacter bambusae]|uniref:nicotine blue oxidoreductase n=1 Tax=Arthrobacter bambusae TaxID=1338426 RepID=UPI0027818FB0|nr:nucleotidyltransferase family protein [Arthrobacter bambusae]MDQ0031822.1 nicotine blue oxidoreductase [Arthrobacter bambusae]MDQ0099900.1 nicotine blue oxidoreductase [Arthrobacter bambusae]
MKNFSTLPTTGVLLAGGAGTRLGLGPKALLPFRGRTLVEVLAKTLLDGGCLKVVVVLGAGAEDVRHATNLDEYLVVDNPEWASGMASSFRIGVAAAPPGHNVMVALVDQPGLTTDVVARLLARHQRGRVTAAGYPENVHNGSTTSKLRRGHPLIIDSTLRADVAETASGDAGARRFLKAHPGLVDVVDCSDLADGTDVDTKEQLHLLND